MASIPVVPASSGPQVSRGIDIVTIWVGPNQEKFTVYKDLICASSTFFGAGFNGAWAEAAGQKMTLREEDPDLFSFFIDWLYAEPNESQTWSILAVKRKWHLDYFWPKIYVMADRLMIAGLKILALKGIEASFSSATPTLPSTMFVHSLYCGDKPVMLQEFLERHITYWLPKSDRGGEAWLNIINLNRGLAGRLTITIVRCAANDTKDHPADIDFWSRYGCDMAALERQARVKDSKSSMHFDDLEVAKLNNARIDKSYGLCASANTTAGPGSPTKANKKRKSR